MRGERDGERAEAGLSSIFAELLHVWQSILHALGLSNALITTQFLQEVVFDAMSQLFFSWQQAYCLLLIYIEAIESHPTQFNLANVFGAGSQDTRCKAARERASRRRVGRAASRRFRARFHDKFYDKPSHRSRASIYRGHHQSIDFGLGESGTL